MYRNNTVLILSRDAFAPDKTCSLSFTSRALRHAVIVFYPHIKNTEIHVVVVVVRRIISSKGFSTKVAGGLCVYDVTNRLRARFAYAADT